MDLADEATTKKLISKATKTKFCENQKCKDKFDFKNLRYYCRQSHKFFCKKCSVTDLVYEHWDSENPERPICRSKEVQAKIDGHENELIKAIDAYDYLQLDAALESC